LGFFFPKLYNYVVTSLIYTFALALPRKEECKQKLSILSIWIFLLQSQ